MNQTLLFECIKSRRTCYQFLEKQCFPVASDAIQMCLEAAIHAPNHKLTQPWLFWVLSESMQTKLAHIYANNRALKNSQTSKEKNREVYQKLYQKAFDKFEAIPQVILVGQVLVEDSLIQKEDYAACACAIQNFQLMAWSLQIGVQWSTGPILSDQESYDLLGITKQKIELIGALYLGQIDESCVPSKLVKRKPLNEVIRFV